MYPLIQMIFGGRRDARVASIEPADDTYQRGLIRRRPNGVVIFLDIDGVLHPGTSETFECLPRFEDCLRLRPKVDVVFSSQWRLTTDLDVLTGYFANDLQDRFIGYTGSEDGPFERHKEILKFCREHRIRDWIAIDDSRDLFPPHCPQLLLTDRIRAFDAQAFEAALGRIPS